MEAGASVDQAMKDGATPLFIAAQQGHLEVVRVLMGGGANVDQAMKDGGSPLVHTPEEVAAGEKMFAGIGECVCE